jgi:uncharacterized oxidoreductase
MKTSGNSVLITGGSAGIGLALAKEFARHGNRVLVCGRDQSELEEASSIIPNLVTHACDLSNEDERLALFDWAITQAPNLNILINNAGIAGPVDLTTDDIDIKRVEQQLLVDLAVPVDLTLRFLPHLRRQPTAALVFVSSGLVYSFDASSPAYSAAKAGVHAWAASTRYQLKETSVAVFDVMPPTVNTGLTPDFDEAAMKALDAMSPEEVATAVIKGIEVDTSEIRIGKVKLLYAASRIAPKATDRMINAQLDKVRNRVHGNDDQ